MTQLAEPRESSRRTGPPDRFDQGRGRWPVVIALVAGMLFSGLTQEWASTWKVHNAGAQEAVAERGALSGMDSYALALMLGGLRGPLVMVLWSKVEGQKIDRDLEDMDTMIEWIRLLQPEFDTVHIFQIWNKAYNISVMMASTASKYQTILDAIDYALRVDRDRPGGLNIADSLARVYGDKLGGKNVTERFFYRKQFREDSMSDDNRKAAYPEDEQRYHRMGLKYVDPKANGPLLDEHNNIIPSLLRPLFPRPQALPPDGEWNDGSELQYIAPYQPFRYGISPTAMGFNYAKRAQVAMTVGGQRPLQVSDTVVDSRPGLLLKQWSEEESDRAVGYEAQAFGLPHEGDAHALETTTAPIGPDRKVADPHALDSAVYSYELSAQVCGDALKEYQRHLANSQYVNPYQQYTSHLDGIKALEALALGDGAYLKAFLPNADRAKSLAQASAHYLDARSRYQRMLLKYAMEGAVAGPLYLSTKIDLDRLSPDALNQLYQRAMAQVEAIPKTQREYDDLRDDYLAYISRADVRLRMLAPYNAPSLLQIH